MIVKLISSVKLILIKKILYRLVNKYWRTKISWTPRRIFISLNKISINKPIFLLGTQGGGLTIISRLIRLHPDVVYITGNNKFWGGNDELHTEPRFKKTSDTWILRGPGFRNLLGNEFFHPMFGFSRSWVYASEELLPYFRKTQNDWTPEIEDEIVSIIKKCIRAYAKNIASARFQDMSQTFSLKVPLLRRIFPDAKFILIIRNPYAMCWREITTRKHKYRFYGTPPDEKTALKLVSEHWNNTFETALKDLNDNNCEYIIKFEDFVQSPEKYVYDILNFCELNTSRYSLPGNDFTIPFGTKVTHKWWPIKTNVNDRYLADIPDWGKTMIENHCFRLIKQFNYSTKY
jgi:hypothetical protein